MNGVMSPGVSAGSKSVGARVKWTAHVSCPSGRSALAEPVEGKTPASTADILRISRRLRSLAAAMFVDSLQRSAPLAPASENHLFVSSPNLVADFLGDHPVANVEVVQETHLDLGADWEGAVFEPIASEAEGYPHVVEHAFRCGEALHRLKLDVFNRVENTQVHLF